MSWFTAKEKFEYFEFPKDKFLEGVKELESQNAIISRGDEKEIKELKEKGMIDGNKSLYTAKGNKKPNIKYYLVNLCDLDGYGVDVWETKNENSVIERGWAMFNNEDNATMVSRTEFSYKKSDVDTNFFEGEK